MCMVNWRADLLAAIPNLLPPVCIPRPLLLGLLPLPLSFLLLLLAGLTLLLLLPAAALPSLLHSPFDTLGEAAEAAALL